MASNSFMSENQSFSEANSSFASLIVDQVQNALEDEEYNTFLDASAHADEHSTPAKSPGRSNQQVDMRTFEQILQVMIQQGAALDRLREELDQYRKECRQQLEYRDTRLRLAEKELLSLRADKEKTMSELEELEEELGALRAIDEEPASANVLTREEHDRIVRRIKDDARARIENIEAQKSHVTVQLSQLQIQVAQLKNRLDDKSYPEEVIENLTKTLRCTIVETCKNADVEARAVKQELAGTRQQLSEREMELELTRNARDNAENEMEEFKASLEDLRLEYDTMHERLAISESMQSQAEANEEALRATQNEVQHRTCLISRLEATHEKEPSMKFKYNYRKLKLSEIKVNLPKSPRFLEQKGMDLSVETYSCSLPSAYVHLAPLRTESSVDVSIQTEEQRAVLHEERDAVLAEAERLRSNVSESSQSDTALIEEIKKLKQDLKDAEGQRDEGMSLPRLISQYLIISKPSVRPKRLKLSELDETRERADELGKTLEKALADVDAMSTRCSEIEKEVHVLKEDLRAAEEKLDAVVKEAAQEKEELESANSRNSQLEDDVKTLKEELQSAEEQAKELNEALAREQETSKENIRLRTQVEEELKGLQAQYSEQARLVTEGAQKAQALQMKLEEEEQKSSASSAELMKTKNQLTERKLDACTLVHVADCHYKKWNLIPRSWRRLAHHCKKRKIAVIKSATVEARLLEITSTLQKTERERNSIEAQLKIAQAALESASQQQSEVESEREQSIMSKEAELQRIKAELQTEIDSLKVSLEEAKEQINKEVRLRTGAAKAGEDEKERLLEEARKLESELSEARRRAIDLEARGKKDRTDVEAKDREIEELQDALRVAENGRKEALRENERIRLKYAEAEGNRAEADMLNEELQQKLSELEEEAKKASSLESDLQSTQAQLAQAMESMNVAKDQASKYSMEIAQNKTASAPINVQIQDAHDSTPQTIAELRAENEQLIAARQKMAAIYGLPAESLNSPRHTPTRVMPTTPVRSSQSLSPSTSSGPLHWLEYPVPPAPPTKRRRISKQPTSGSSGNVAAGTSPASAILLDEADDRMSTPPPSPIKKEQNGDIPRHMVELCSTFARLSTWQDDEGRYLCGFCALHNSKHTRDRRTPLTFDPSQYPITFWKHCLMLHKDDLKPDIETWLKADGPTLSETEPANDLPSVLANFVAWKDEAGYTCGLCK
ncbi:hypothetical protein ACEPAG_3470 [Sanghuangporus baumii]